MSPYDAARTAFNAYCGMGEGVYPADPGSELQVRHFRWAEHKVKHTIPADIEGVLGVSEELGELAAAVGKLNHAILNHHQDRRGMREIKVLREAVADGLADMCIFAMHLATAMRLDFWTLVRETALKVIRERDWKAYPICGGLR